MALTCARDLHDPGRKSDSSPPPSMKAKQNSNHRKAASKKATNTAKGKRYSAEEKAKIIAVVHEVNADRGRGGITAASNQFGVSPLTISHWMRDAGMPSPRSGLRAAANHPAIFRELADLHEQIAVKQSELMELESKFQRLKSKL